MFPKTDIWRVGVLPAPMTDIVTNGLGDIQPIWLPPGRPFTYLADPFGMWRDGNLYVFVEVYDYRTRRGGIDVLTLNGSYEVVDRRPCLRAAWHLSYPFVFETDGETYMLPEAHKSGTLTLYRATCFPDIWTPICDIPLQGGAVDASPVFFEGLWWIFHAPATDIISMMGALHAAYATSITGPWHPHSLNPLRERLDGARPAGTPVVINGSLVLPLQDCSHTYGGAVRMLTIGKLGPDVFTAEIGDPIVGGTRFEPYIAGLHTLSDCGNVTLVDAKRFDRSLGIWLVDASRAPLVARKALNKLWDKVS
jgi:hypothetical protein